MMAMQNFDLLSAQYQPFPSQKSRTFDMLATPSQGSRYINPNSKQINAFTDSGEFVDSFQYMKNTADPFNKERASYITKLRDLINNPASVANNGAYKWSFDQGQKALQAQQAATGNRLSGRGAVEAVNYGQGAASQQFFKLAELFAGLSGGNQNPAAGSDAMIRQYSNIANERAGLRSNPMPMMAPRPSSNAPFGGGWA
jgi:hypothetical protein